MIDDILPLLHGKKYFSLVDTMKGYWHVELDHESSMLCTFDTPFGRYRFKHLPFGVVVSQDIFQRKLDDIYKNIPNVTGIADDIIIFGSTEEEHDQAFISVLETTRANNVSLNAAKLQFKQPSVDFLWSHTDAGRHSSCSRQIPGHQEHFCTIQCQRAFVSTGADYLP